MQAKLTLKMDKDVIESMKCYAANNKKSLSRLVEDFFKTSIEETKDTISISPLVKELTGIISEKDMDNAGYIDFNSSFADFEDALQYYTAIKHGMETLLTRNIKDYKEKDLIIQTPEQFIKGSFL